MNPPESYAEPVCEHCGALNHGWKVSHSRITTRRCEQCRKRNNVKTHVVWDVETYKGEIYKRKKNKELGK